MITDIDSFWLGMAAGGMAVFLVGVFLLWIAKSIFVRLAKSEILGTIAGAAIGNRLTRH